MIGVVVATHGNFGPCLLSTLQMIYGGTEGMVAVSLESEDSLEVFQEKLDSALKRVDPQSTGALVLVDMLGGTPFNVAMRMAPTTKLRVVTGVNLPMLIKIASHREEPDLDAFTQEIQEATRESIITSVELFKKQP
jgi:PTS system mannose-specific IIA component